MAEHQLDRQSPRAAWFVSSEAKALTNPGDDRAFCEWCHVLTLLDAQTRYLLRAEAKPGKLQQNGRLERCHCTLKEDVPPAENLVQQRRALDEWRREYNEERPHEALGDIAPERLYKKSPRAGSGLPPSSSMRMAPS